jgi:hypothetical protein
MYFYIIKGEGQKAQGPRHKRRKAQKPRHREEERYEKRKASLQIDFTFFFIWQAIVRGRLFLQRTFFLLWEMRKGNANTGMSNIEF